MNGDVSDKVREERRDQLTPEPLQEVLVSQVPRSCKTNPAEWCRPIATTTSFREVDSAMKNKLARAELSVLKPINSHAHT